MSSPSEPSRLLDAHDPAFADLEDGLRQSRALGPSAEQQLRMRSALGLTERPGDGGQRPTDGVRSSGDRLARVPRWLKLLVGGVLGLAAMGGMGVLRQLGAVERAAPRSSPLPTAPASAPAVVRSAPVSRVELERAPTPTGAQESSPPAPRSRRAAGAHDRALSGLAPRGANATLTEELPLLRRAKAYAVSEPDRALALLDEHQRRFAHGALAQEREVIAIEALLARGDLVRAQQRAAQFLAQNPGSAHARRVRALLGAHARGAADFDTKHDAPAHPSL